MALLRGLKKIKIRGQSLLLLPQRAVFWRQAQMLIVGDPHFGKAHIFRAGGIPIPAGTTAADIGRLSSLIDYFQAKELLVLGDLMHGSLDEHHRLIEMVGSWREQWCGVYFSLVTGNHDHCAGPPQAAFRFDRIVAHLVVPPFLFSHKPAPGDGHYSIVGHIHPAVSIKGQARQKETLPCFCFGDHMALLPAFGGFTGNHVIHPEANQRVYVIADQEVIEMVSK